MDKIAIGADHAGFKLKEFVKKLLREKGLEVVDVGTYNEERCHYPEYAKRVAKMVSQGEVYRGILICGSGIGMSIVANKFKGVRAALCHNIYSAKFSRLHNDSNILCLGGRVTGEDLTREIVEVWLSTPFEGGRHFQRLQFIEEIERENFRG
ncbi:MAG TPA: ribose 5-phosphate isomerase B [Aquifex aeolicus]|uniref:Ribose 5-phosphate isomerase B n=1 Tax=Aquifex aeolicus TaxID=63363 RepID=A0A9D1CFS3_AQUAO|nr:ribose 5-phosphate isomerase B [Aquificales bacterium]HIP98437.1 ribose 5-phosphate isomerase B [Aquifex aeolicus]HIQ26460.1 ribose 5-phosphate isomerase B [Aquifex aeolicus]